MKKSSFLLLLFFSLSCNAKTAQTGKTRFYKKVFKEFTRIETIQVKDTVSAEQNNRNMDVIYNKKKIVGFVRPINTTTGCNSACLPVIYSSFYNADGDYIKLMSENGLTKIYHAPFTAEDYGRLDFLLALNPGIFKKVTDPKQMTDAISGETLKVYQEHVVKGAAYSTLRINLYNQESLQYIKKFKQSKKD